MPGAPASADTNFYNDAFRRAGFEDDARAIQRLWLEGKRDEAAKRVPDAMVTEFQAIGTPEMVQERFRRHQEAGVNTLSLRLETTGADASERIALLEQAADLVAGL